MPASSDILPSTAPRPERSRRALVQFVLRFWKPQWRPIALSVTMMLLSACLAMLMPFTAREVAAYNGGPDGRATTPSPLPTDAPHLHTSKAVPAMPPGPRPPSPFGGTHVRKALGDWADRTFGPTASALLAMVRHVWLPDTFTAEDELFLHGLFARCCLMAMVVVGTHVLSLLGHLMAYRAGAGTQAALLQQSLREILSSPFPERIAVVNPAQLTHILVTSGRTASDILGALLTNVLSSLLGAVTLLLAMLYISTTLTAIIGVLVVIVQYVYYVAGRTQRARSAVASHQEAVVHASLSNAIQRSETVYVFQCRDFILDRLQETLTTARRLNDALNWSIHGYACASTSSTTLIFVVVLGISSFLHYKGGLDLMDIGLYFMFVRQFVSRLLQLSQEVSQIQADLVRLETLRSALAWYSHEDDDAEESVASMQRNDGDGKPFTKASRVVVDDAASAQIGLDEVTFYYPTVPTFITAASTKSEAEKITSVSEEAASSPSSPSVRGIHRFSVAVAPGRITALYGPSGCGKSTCLRLLARLARPHAGTVHTRPHVLLLEQQHAVFLGSIAENVLLEEVEASSPSPPLLQTEAVGEDDQTQASRVRTATTKGGCANFIKDPFRTRIENVDSPPFSGGQLQRICLARIFDPKRMNCTLVLLDEPTTGLDADSAGKLLVTIQELRDKHHKTVLIATHDERVANIADTVIRLSPIEHS